MRSAGDAKKRGVLEGIKDDLWTEIKKAVDRLARRTARVR